MGLWPNHLRFGMMLASAAVMVLAAVIPARAQSPSLEMPIKAAFLFKFGEFVEWPATAFAAPGDTLNICVVGDPEFANLVAKAVATETVAGRRVAAQALGSVASTDPCHIAYIAGSEKQSAAEALEALGGRPVLTVTDEAHGAETGAIHFVVRNNRVRFAIDDRLAAANGLNLRSALLGIAIAVQRRD